MAADCIECTCGHKDYRHVGCNGPCSVIVEFGGRPYRCKCHQFLNPATIVRPGPDQINPAHYKSDPSGVECIQITRHRNFNIGNAIKYLWRAGLKNGEATRAEDLEKALWYIKDELGLITGSGEHAGQMALKQSMQQEGLIK